MQRTPHDDYTFTKVTCSTKRIWGFYPSIQILLDATRCPSSNQIVSKFTYMRTEGAFQRNALRGLLEHPERANAPFTRTSFRSRITTLTGFTYWLIRGSKAHCLHGCAQETDRRPAEGLTVDSFLSSGGSESRRTFVIGDCSGHCRDG